MLVEVSIFKQDMKIFYQEVLKKKEQLYSLFRDKKRLIIAFSGGVDSSLLLKLAHDVLNKRVIAVTASSIIHPPRELSEAKKIVSHLGLEHIIFQSNEMDIEDFRKNDPLRCYYCKRELLQKIIVLAKKMNISYIAHGINIDDLSDYRPGLKAAEELNILAPFVDVKMRKEEIRWLAKEMGLPNWNRPAMSCLATRIPYGRAITNEAIEKIEKAEDLLYRLGFLGARVRYFGNLAKIEVLPEQLMDIMEEKLREEIIKGFHKIGFTHVTLDMAGYRSGNMNKDLN